MSVYSVRIIVFFITVFIIPNGLWFVCGAENIFSIYNQEGVNRDIQLSLMFSLSCSLISFGWTLGQPGWEYNVERYLKYHKAIVKFFRVRRASLTLTLALAWMTSTVLLAYKAGGLNLRWLDQHLTPRSNNAMGSLYCISLLFQILRL